MLGGKNQASQRPTAFGTMLQASTYGATIPTVKGCTRSPLLTTWAADLRKGASDKKAKKKGVTTYVERITFLSGSNPIQGALQFWGNNSLRYPLNFVKVSATLNGSGQLTIPADPYFYYLIAVTADVDLSGTFNDYGGPGAVPYSGVTEVPLWNGYQHGPDLIRPTFAKVWPFVYSWTPANPTVVKFPFTQGLFAPSDGLPGGTGTVHFYYAQLSALIKHKTPISRLRLTFENELANGPEYAGFEGQRVVMPWYAGFGSPNIDLGAGAMIPSIKPEILGSDSLYSRGDCDFADMIEDVLKSGMIQTGTRLGEIHRGLNLNELPGTIQRNFYQNLEPSNPTLEYYQPNGVGNPLLAFCSWRPSTGADPTILDTAANDWIPIFLGGSNAQMVGIWYAIANGAPTAPAINEVSFHYNGDFFPYDTRPYILEMDPGSQTVDATQVASGTTPADSHNHKQTVSITVTGEPTYIVAMYSSVQGFVSGTPLPSSPWKKLFPAGIQDYTCIYGRTVAKPGTYSFEITVGPGVPWCVVLVAFKASDPVSYPKALGNILDEDSLDLVRKQCRAAGLIGSVSMDSQRKAGDWLKDFGTCANMEYVWSGFRLKCIPRSEVSAYGNGTVFIPTTAAGPIANLTERDYISDGPTIDRLVPGIGADDDPAQTLLQIEHRDRSNDYNTSVVTQPEAATLTMYGPRKGTPQVLHMIQDPVVARMILAIQTRHNAYVKPVVISVKLQAQWGLLEAMDLVTFTDTKQGIVTKPCRLVSVEEDDQFQLDVQAEPFIYGAHAPNSDLTAPVATPNLPSSNTEVALVNPPVFAEPPLKMSLTGVSELWIPVSDSDPNYGGCFVWVSTDGGASYGSQPLDVIQGNAITGILAADWPAGLDPDTLNDLLLDLSESNGALPSFPLVDENNFVNTGYVEGAPTPTPSFNNAANSYVSIGPNVDIPAPFPVLIPGVSAAISFCSVRGHNFGLWLSLFPHPLVRFYNTSPSGCITVLDPTFVSVKPTGLCPHGETAMGGDFAAYADVSSIGFDYDFEATSAAFDNMGGVAGVVYAPAGSGLPPNLSLHGTVFDNTGAAVTYAGFGGYAILVELRPLTDGNPSLFVALVTGTNYSVPPTGWTIAYTSPTSSQQILTKVGPPVGSSGCNFELISHSTATLTSPSHYTLPASPNGIRRAVFGQPSSGPGDHPPGRRFAFLNATQLAKPPGILKTPLQESWIGKTLYFKFTAFNVFGGGVQDLADVVAYPYTPCGLATPPTITDGIIQIPVTAPSTAPFTVPHGLGEAPAFVTVQMTSGGDIWTQRPLAFDGTNVYLVGSDTGVTGIVTLWMNPAEAAVALAPSAPGNFSVPHGLAGAPTLAIVQMDSGGDVWKQGSPYTSSNINLVASDSGITGKVYAWRVAPRNTLLPRFVSVALAPGAPGNFSVPHGLGAVPKMVIVRMSSGGRIWLQNPTPGASSDATNLFLTASDAGITGEAEVWA